MVMAPIITAALANAPMVGLTPMIVATASPGSTPCASASPTKVMPRSTTQVPTTPQASAASEPAARARCMVIDSKNGSTTQCTGRHYCSEMSRPLVRIIAT